MTAKKKLKAREQEPEASEDDSELDQDPQPSSPLPMLPVEPEQPAVPTSVLPETVTIPADTMRALALELAQMREELNQLKMTGSIVQPTQPRDLKTAIIDMIGQLAGAASKF